MEQPAFYPLQGEDREIRGDDDENGEEDWTLHFVGGIADDLHQRSMLVDMRLDVAQDVLDHHDGAVDNHAKVERPQRQQVRRDMVQVQQNGSEQEGERNRDGDHERAAHVSEEQEED